MKTLLIAGLLLFSWVWACNVPPPAPPPSVHEVVLTWQPSVGAQSYDIYRDSVAVGGSSSTDTWTDTNVVSGKTYSYCVASYNGAQSPCSATVIATIP